MSKQYVVISCPVETYSGYGARARDFVKATIEAKKDEWDVWILPQRWGNTPYGYLDDHEEWNWMRKHLIQGGQLTQQPDVWMQITIPNEFQPVGKYNIGVTAGIETTIVDAGWLTGCNRMDLTLISSEHSKQVLLDTVAERKDKQGNTTETIRVTKPVEVIFEGIDLNTYFHIEDKDIEETELVKCLDEIPESFAYLFVGHWLGGEIGEDRKNVGMTIKVFLETFKNKKNAPCLILKTSQAGGSILDKTAILKKINAIRKTVKGTLPNIYLLHGDLDEIDMNYLYNHPKVKAMINLTKGEGFGRPLLEFSMAKKPIICSGWSGQMDFLNPEFTNLVGGRLTQVHPSAVVPNIILAESSWYTADYVQAGQLLVDIHANYKKYTDKASRQAFYSKSNFSFEKMQEKLKEYYVKYVKEQPKLVLPTLPKLKKI
jgi:glycosyltransferase involved in cell wall biosynthesis